MRDFIEAIAADRGEGLPPFSFADAFDFMEASSSAIGVAAAAAVSPDPATSRLISGTRFADDIRGTNRADEIFARGGADLVRGRDGGDLIDGGKGDDLIYGGNGRDDIFGARGRDSLYGGRGRDDFFFDEDDTFDRVRDFREGDTLVVDGVEGDFAGARRRDIDLEAGRRYDELYVFDDLVARIYGDPVIRDDILLLT